MVFRVHRIAIVMSMALGLALGCGDSSKESAGSGSAKATPQVSASCAAEARLMAAKLAVANPTLRIHDPSEGLERDTPRVEKAEPLQTYGPLVRMEGGTVYFQNEPMADIAGEMRARARREVELFEHNRDLLPDPMAPMVVYLWLEGKASAGDMLAIVKALPAQYVPRLVVYERGQKPAFELAADAPERIREFWTRLMGTREVGEQANILTQALQKGMGLCAPIMRLFGNAAAVAPGDKIAFFQEKTPKALEKCQCKVGDMELLQNAMLAVVDAHRQNIRWLPLALDDGAKMRITLPAGATVNDWVKAFEALGEEQQKKPIHLMMQGKG